MTVALQQQVGDGLGFGRDRAHRERSGNAFGLRQRGGHFGQHGQPLLRVTQRLGRDGHGPVIGHRMDARDGGTVAGGLTQALREQRVVLAQIRAQHQGHVELRQRRDGPAQQRGLRALPAQGVILLTQTAVDVLAAHGAQDLRGQGGFFDRGVRRHQGSQLAAVVLHPQQALGGEVQRRRPVDDLPSAIALDHRDGSGGCRRSGLHS